MADQQPDPNQPQGDQQQTNVGAQPAGTQQARRDPAITNAVAQINADDPLSLHYGSSQPGEGVLLTPSQKAALGPQSEPQTVQMDVLRDGSFQGEYRHTGDTIDVPVDLVETLTLAGFAARTDRQQ